MRGVMPRHVTSLLASYVEGQLSTRQAVAVRSHVMTCAACRDRLARHERLAADLRLTLGQSPTLHPAQVRAWWAALNARTAVTTPPQAALHRLLPALLTLALLVLPFAMGFTGAASAVPTSTWGAPVLNVTLESALAAKHVELASETIAWATTAAPAISTETVLYTPAPVEPAPRAPTTR